MIPYIDQIFENSKLVAEKLGLSSTQYTNTTGRVKVISVFHGLKPDVLKYLKERKEHQTIIFLYLLDFISGHIEGLV